MADDVGFYTKAQVRDLVGLSFTHTTRLEGRGDFPKRIALGPFRASRRVYLRSEVQAWMKARVAARDKANRPE